MSFLYDYQKDAVLRMRNGSILCGKVGSGKSRTALAYYYTMECKGALKREISPPRRHIALYIITTARKRDTKEWEAEIEPFQYIDDVTIDSWNNVMKYKDVTGAFFIFDEQRVVGYGAWTKAFLKIAKHNHWILLSATPGDTWMDYMPVFIANGFFKNKKEFVAKHVVMSYYGSYPKIERYLDQGVLQSYRNQILVDMDYVHQVTKEERTIITEYDRALYKETLRSRWDPFQNEPIQNASGLCVVLRKICGLDPSKIEALRSVMMKHDRIIVFYNYDHELEALRNAGFDIPMAEWNGHKHEPIPDSERWLYLVQYTSGCEGWNCTLTNVIVFFSESYSYKQMKQAAGRIDRLTSPYDTLYYYHLRSRSSIDLAVQRALSDKKNFNESSFGKSKN